MPTDGPKGNPHGRTTSAAAKSKPNKGRTTSAKAKAKPNKGRTRRMKKGK